MFKKALTILAIGGALSLALDAKAQYVTYTDTINSTPTDWNNTVALQQFNPSLGTLDSIDITISSGLTTIISVTNSAPSGSHGTAKTELQISLDTTSIGGYDLFGTGGGPDLDYYSSGYGYTLSSGQGVTSGTIAGSSSDNTGLLTNSGLLSYFIGTGDVDLGASTLTLTSLGNTGGNTVEDQVTSGGLTTVITYDYTPAPVPEPSPVAMIGAGLMGLLFVMRLRPSKK